MMYLIAMSAGSTIHNPLITRIICVFMILVIGTIVIAVIMIDNN